MNLPNEEGYYIVQNQAAIFEAYFKDGIWICPEDYGNMTEGDQADIGVAESITHWSPFLNGKSTLQKQIGTINL